MVVVVVVAVAISTAAATFHVTPVRRRAEAVVVAISTAAATFHITPVRRRAEAVVVAISTAAATFHITPVRRRAEAVVAAVVAKAAVVAAVRAASPTIMGITKAVSLRRRHCEERKRRSNPVRRVSQKSGLLRGARSVTLRRSQASSVFRWSLLCGRRFRRTPWLS